MTREEAIRLLESALDAAPGSIREETQLDSILGWDSVGQLSVIAAFDSSLGVVLPPQKISACKTAADLLDLVKDKLD